MRKQKTSKHKTHLKKAQRKAKYREYILRTKKQESRNWQSREIQTTGTNMDRRIG